MSERMREQDLLNYLRLHLSSPRPLVIGHDLNQLIRLAGQPDYLGRATLNPNEWFNVSEVRETLFRAIEDAERRINDPGHNVYIFPKPFKENY